MPRYLGRNTIAYDQRTGKKIFYRDLVEDGEIPGLRTHRREADSEHPQKYLRPVGADQIALYRPSPESARHDLTLTAGRMPASSNLWEGRETVPIITVGTAAAATLVVDGVEVEF